MNIGSKNIFFIILCQLVAEFFLCVQPSGLVSHSDLDDRAIEALKEFNEEGALQVLSQFKDSDLSHVQVSLMDFFFSSTGDVQ